MLYVYYYYYYPSQRNTNSTGASHLSNGNTMSLTCKSVQFKLLYANHGRQYNEVSVQSPPYRVKTIITITYIQKDNNTNKKIYFNVNDISQSTRKL